MARVRARTMQLRQRPSTAGQRGVERGGDAKKKTANFCVPRAWMTTVAENAGGHWGWLGTGAAAVARATRTASSSIVSARQSEPRTPHTNFAAPPHKVSYLIGGIFPRTALHFCIGREEEGKVPIDTHSAIPQTPQSRREQARCCRAYTRRAQSQSRPP